MLVCYQWMDNSGMLLEILSWLPLKSLLRFICVSKQWKTLISSHPFRKLHREKHTSSPPLLIASYSTYDIEDPPFNPNLHIYTYLITFDLEGKSVKEITLPIPPNHFSMTKPPYQSKLLCFVSYQWKKFYLYIPSTRRSFLMTNPSRLSSPEFDQHCSAAYGYIPSKDEYIMVHLVKLSNEKLYCEVLNNISISNDNFKLHYNQWRSIEATIIIRKVVGTGVFVGGAFYWQALTYAKIFEDGLILSFDVETECFSTLGYPQDLPCFNYTSTLLELKDDLYLSNFPKSPEILTVWKLSPDNKLWSQHWKFDFQEMFGFVRGAREWRCFSWEIFIYNLKYLKGYDHQPSDDQVSVEMGEVVFKDLLDAVPMWTFAEAVVHTNLFTL